VLSRRCEQIHFQPKEARVTSLAPLNRQLLKLLLAQQSSESQQVVFSAFTAPAVRDHCDQQNCSDPFHQILSFYNKGFLSGPWLRHRRAIGAPIPQIVCGCEV